MLLRALAQNIFGNTCLEVAYNLFTLRTDRHQTKPLLMLRHWPTLLNNCNPDQNGFIAED